MKEAFSASSSLYFYFLLSCLVSGRPICPVRGDLSISTQFPLLLTRLPVGKTPEGPPSASSASILAPSCAKAAWMSSTHRGSKTAGLLWGRLIRDGSGGFSPLGWPCGSCPLDNCQGRGAPSSQKNRLKRTCLPRSLLPFAKHILDSPGSCQVIPMPTETVAGVSGSRASSRTSSCVEVCRWSR